MPTSFCQVDDRLFVFSVGLAASARLFTTRQLAAHPDLSGRSMPSRRAGEFLRLRRDAFEHIHGIHPYLHLWRLTAAEKRRQGLKYRNVSASQHTPHWLMMGDVWIHLTLNGLRPVRWFTEGKDIGGFDVFCIIQEQPYLMEVQRSDLTKREWQQKWHRRAKWLKQRRWLEASWAQKFSSQTPRILLVSEHKMNVDVPRGVIYSPTLDRLHWILKKPPQ